MSRKMELKQKQNREHKPRRLFKHQRGMVRMLLPLGHQEFSKGGIKSRSLCNPFAPRTPLHASQTACAATED